MLHISVLDCNKENYTCLIFFVVDFLNYDQMLQPVLRLALQFSKELRFPPVM